MKKLVLIIALFCSFSAVAENVWLESKIKYIYPIGDGSFILIFKDDSPECTNPNKYHYVRAGEGGVTAEAVKNYLAVSLAAASSSREVNVRFDDSTATCYIQKMFVKFN